MVLRSLAVCVLLIAFDTILAAQLDTASIIGTVSDATGAALAGAKVDVLSVGMYRVTVAALGFKKYVQENIRLNVSDRIHMNILLTPGQVNEVVNVTGEAPVVDTASTTLGGVVAPEQMSELPLNGRSLTQLLATTPGWSQLGVAPNLNGATTARLFETASRFLLDGTDSGQVGFRSRRRGISNSRSDHARQRGICRRSAGPAELIFGGVRAGQWRCDQLHHQVGYQPIPRQSVRVFPQRSTRCEAL